MPRQLLRFFPIAFLVFAHSVLAQEWAPSKPVRIIVPIVGSTNDVLARLVAPELSKALGQPVIVENKGGGGGTIGADMVAKSDPDGHTLLVGFNGPLAINVTLFDKLPYDPLKDLAPITLAVTSPQFLVVHPGVPVKNAAEFVARARANPGQMSYGSVSVGSASHLTMEMLKTAAKIDVVHVPYKGASPAVADLLGGQIQAAFFVPGNVLQYLKDPLQTVRQLLELSPKVVLWERLMLSDGPTHADKQRTMLFNHGPGAVPAGFRNRPVVNDIIRLSSTDLLAAHEARYRLRAGTKAAGYSTYLFSRR